jgi:4-hydroxy-3-methylbut-2-en-1-yl diphosphate reductase
MKFTSTVVAVLAFANASNAFVPASVLSKSKALLHPTCSHFMSSSVEEEIAEQRELTKKEKRLEYMRSDKFYRKGFKEVRETVENVMGSQFKSSTVDDLKASNYVMERDGVKVYLAKVCGELRSDGHNDILEFVCIDYYS